MRAGNNTRRCTYSREVAGICDDYDDDGGDDDDSVDGNDDDSVDGGDDDDSVDGDANDDNDGCLFLFQPLWMLCLIQRSS